VLVGVRVAVAGEVLVNIFVGVLIGVLEGVKVAVTRKVALGVTDRVTVKVEAGFFVGDFRGVGVRAGAFGVFDPPVVGVELREGFVPSGCEGKVVLVAEATGTAGEARFERP
jgi:hypothetical protein